MHDENPKVKIIDYAGYNYVLNPDSITRKQGNKFKKYEGYIKSCYDLWEEVKIFHINQMYIIL